MSEDPTKLTNQPALTTSTGRSWLIVGLLLVIISLAVLIPLAGLPPAGAAIGAAIAVSVLYIAMAVTRLVVAPGRRRLTLMASEMIGIAAVSFITVGIVAATAAAGL
ncbi:hypothetical protein [Cryobacterium sp. M15]|jgi:hypothetical protein|uniref:hypothetical protein n=1 Tax=Cryobacterium sp. M15 TaxID=2048291 RepID=UPI000CE4349E|nr:hypothetical protein [Cryobacterium sp. M15]